MLAFVSFSSSVDLNNINASCVMRNGKPVFFDSLQEKWDANAYWENSLNSSGFYRMHIKGNENSSTHDMMTCAGFLEGYLSHDHMLNHFNLIFDIQDWKRNRIYPTEIRSFLEKNLEYTRQSIDAYREVKYWNEIGVIMTQFDGIVAGYQQKDEENGVVTMDEFDHWFLQSEGDMFDISEKYPGVEQPPEKVEPGAHCSGMIRLLPDYSDIYFSHDAWSDYRELHGELKEYDLPVKEYKASRITLSTRIGKLSSFDDFYINDKGLFILETTLSNFNEPLFDEIVPNRLFTWIRATHATWTSETGKEWTETFAKHNSGTYNNQYLVIDSNKFTRGEKPSTDLLWIIEQLPTITKSADITDVLVNDGYFPSINTPYFEDLFNFAHFPEKIASWGEDGNYWDLKTSSRFILMAREAPRIMNFSQFQDFMRFNLYKKDPYSNGDPGQMILARYDLRSGHQEHFPKKLFGGLDSKALKLTEAVASMRFHGCGSPEHKNNPPFNFSDWNYKHDGLIDVWEHDWQSFESLRGDKCSIHNKKQDECLDTPGCGFCSYTQDCYSGYKDAPSLIKCEAGWSVKTELQSWALTVIIAVSVIVSVFVIIIYLAAYMSHKNQ